MGPTRINEPAPVYSNGCAEMTQANRPEKIVTAYKLKTLICPTWFTTLIECVNPDA